MRNPYAAAYVAGAVGTGALGVLVTVRNAWLGHPPPYAARNIARHVLSRLFRRKLSRHEASQWAFALRAGYGPLLGMGWGLVRVRTAKWTLLHSGVLLGLGVLAFERAAFPVFKATALANTWSRAEHVWLFAQTALFGVVTEATMRWLVKEEEPATQGSAG
ncbi:hypothetical protein COCOR_07997 [Corallococcus coralloides DSM 2259]|uniref:Uncharacterized protein n=1 Tax=Corallococcus coralloides (strain ATCC 25202 / DSM 2259 / NBRC 100086 / M2) TaxID=1144275 RepID=H8MY29_CORCM|nr:hypothetical protein [Corallococcus coralloides]AFE07868.1 hypothetical protein COCOR_07997 [Corallococcus coralloides DSM 2259]